MTDLRYVSPRTLDEAVSAFAAAGSAARILAGGTDLLVQMRSGAVKPGVIVDIKKIGEMTAIEETAFVLAPPCLARCCRNIRGSEKSGPACWRRST